jgi:hypothetical protein
VGIFVAVDHLRRAGALSPEDEATYLAVDAWFDRELPNPPFYDDGNTIGAVTWFVHPVPEPMLRRVEALTAILDRHGVAHDTVVSTDPGEVVHRDAWQVGVVPRERRPPTPRDGPPLGPTTGGTKLHLATPAARAILDQQSGDDRSAEG